MPFLVFFSSLSGSSLASYVFSPQKSIRIQIVSILYPYCTVSIFIVHLRRRIALDFIYIIYVILLILFWFSFWFLICLLGFVLFIVHSFFLLRMIFAVVEHTFATGDVNCMAKLWKYWKILASHIKIMVWNGRHHARNRKRLHNFRFS